MSNSSCSSSKQPTPFGAPKRTVAPDSGRLIELDPDLSLLLRFMIVCIAQAGRSFSGSSVADHVDHGDHGIGVNDPDGFESQHHARSSLMTWRTTMRIMEPQAHGA
jgi:hypothetical protein